MSTTTKFALAHTGIALGVMTALGIAPEEAGAQTIEEITVTARRRAQNIQDVPLYIQALDEQTMREKMLRGFEDYARELTSVSFGTTSPGATTIAFRGAISQPTGFDQLSSSTVYLDEIPITRDGQNADIRLYDMERIEALSGPQPTLYGAGSQSGTLKFVTRKPDTQENGGWFALEGGVLEEGDGAYNASFALNRVLVQDKLAVRLVGFYESEGGYVDNVLGTTSLYSDDNGDGNNADVLENNINDYESTGVRAMLRFEPNERWTIDAGVIYQNTELGGLFDFNPAFGELNTVKFRDENRDDEWYNLALTIQGDLGFADLTIAGGTHNRTIDYNFDSTAYMSLRRQNNLDTAEYYLGERAFIPDLTTCYYYYLCFLNAYDFGPNPTGTISLDQEVKSFAQEIRLVSKDDGNSKFNWLVGAFYERTNNDWDYVSNVDDFAANGGNGSIFAYYGVEPTNDWFDQGFRPGLTYNGRPGASLEGQLQDIETFAVFGEMSYDITDTVRVTGGGRWFTTDRRVSENSLYVNTVSDNFDVTQTTKDFSPRVNVTWTPSEDAMVYATYSEGVRPGQQNGGVTTNPTAIALGFPREFDADRLVNYEIGTKATWMDGRLLTNLTLFTMDWEDYQLQTFAAGAGTFTTNAGSASIDGAEAQFGLAINENWDFSGGFTYIDARLDGAVQVSDAITVGAAGDPLPVVPEWKVNASLVYRKPLEWKGLEFTGRFDYNYVDESVNGTTASVSLYGGTGTVPRTQPSYDVGSLYFSVDSPNGWSAYLGIDNLWDERAITYIWPRFGDDRAFTLRPREIVLGFYKEF